VVDRGEHLAHRRRRIVVERSVLLLDGPTGSRIGHAGVALGDETLHARGVARRQEVVGALDAQLVGERELTIEATHVDRWWDGGELVHDDVGLCLAHGPPHRVGIQRVGHHGLRAEAADLIALGFRASHPDNIVPRGDQHGNKLLADRTRGAGDEHLHGEPLLVRTPPQTNQRLRL
jgi:hypothetical protein